VLALVRMQCKLLWLCVGVWVGCAHCMLTLLWLVWRTLRRCLFSKAAGLHGEVGLWRGALYLWIEAACSVTAVWTSARFSRASSQ
jgi:hypothetical protein